MTTFVISQHTRREMLRSGNFAGAYHDAGAEQASFPTATLT